MEDDKEAEKRVDEVADQELRAVDGEVPRREVGHPSEGRDDRGDEILYQGLDHGAKSRADHDRDRQVDHEKGARATR